MSYRPGYESDTHIEPRLCCNKKPDRQEYTGYSEIWCESCHRFLTASGDLYHVGYLWNRSVKVRDVKGRFVKVNSPKVTVATKDPCPMCGCCNIKSASSDLIEDTYYECLGCKHKWSMLN